VCVSVGILESDLLNVLTIIFSVMSPGMFRRDISRRFIIIRPVKTEWWGAGVVILSGARCRLAYGPADATVSCSSKIQIGSTFLVPAHLGSPGQRAVKRVCVSYDNARVTIDLRRTSNLRNISRRADGSRLQFTCKIVRYSVNRAPDVTAVSQPQFFTATPAVRENHHLGRHCRVCERLIGCVYRLSSLVE